MYIDVRGPHPILFDGMKATELANMHRRITLEHALEILSQGKSEQGRRYAEAHGIEVVNIEMLPTKNLISYNEFIAKWTGSNPVQAEGRLVRNK